MTEQANDTFELPAEVKAEIDQWTAKYPPEQKQSAVLSALHAVQGHYGWVQTPHLDAVAEYLGMPPVSVYEVATFYSMINIKPVGRHTIAVCTNISCMLCGADSIVEHIENKLDVRLGESTADGRFYLKQEEECLAACIGGPMMAVDGHYHENLTPEKVDKILDALD